MNGRGGDRWDEQAFLEAAAFEEALNRLTSQESDEILELLRGETAIPAIPAPEPEPEWPPVHEPEPEPEWPPIHEPAPAPIPAPVPIPAPKPISGGRHETYEWLKALVSAVIFVGIVSLFFVRVIGVSGDSMNPTLEDGERLLLSNLFYSPRPGDIVIFAEKDLAGGQIRPGGGEPLVKRVIAVEGQTIDIDFQTGRVWVDDVVQPEPYIKEPTARHGDMTFPFTVPPGAVFVMGDNRNDSLDSRFTVIGPVDTRRVLGHVLLRVWPPERLGTVYEP